MQSEQQHIDDFFRNKEEEWAPDTSQAGAHWQHLDAALSSPAVKPPGNKVRVQASRSIIKYIGGFMVVTILTVVTYTATKNKKATAPKTKTQQTVVKSIPPAAQQKTTTASVPATTTATKTIAATNKPTPVAIKKTVENIPPQTNTAKKKTPPVQPAPATTPKKKESATKLIADFYRSFEKKGQEFVIRSNRDTTLLAKEGTRLIIPANAFVTTAGLVKTGTVKIILTEFYTYDDIVAAKLSTTSNGQQLVTGGMMEIKATAEGEALQLAPKKTIDVVMPANNYDNRMQLFTGAVNTSPSQRMNYVSEDTTGFNVEASQDNTGINWIPAGQNNQVFNREPSKATTKSYPAVGPHHVHGRKKAIAIFYIANDLQVPDKVIKEKLQKTYDGYYDKVKVRRVGKRYIYGAIDSVMMGYKNITGPKSKMKKDSARYADWLNRDTLATGNTTTTDASAYRFTISTLGWINCDRFLNDPRPKVNLTINLGEGNDAANFMSQLVFTRFRSVMNCVYNGNKIQFQNIPENELVQIVSVGVRDGKVISSVREIKATSKEVHINFEEVTPGEFRKKLETLSITQ